MKRKAQKRCKKIANYKHTLGKLVDAYHYKYYIQVNIEEERKWETYKY